jgi:hypothetical protein
LVGSWAAPKQDFTAGGKGLPALGAEGAELRKLKQLAEEKRKLKSLVSALTLDKHMGQEALALRKKF